MNRRLQVDEAASEDVLEHASYLSFESADLADRFIDRVEETLSFLTEFPGVGWRFRSSRAELRGIRVWPVRGFKSVLIFYRITPRFVRVLRVRHGARDPDRQV